MYWIKENKAELILGIITGVSVTLGIIIPIYEIIF